MLKNVFRPLIPVIYLLLIVFSLALFLKPGASIFYYKIRLEPHRIKPDAGLAYRYPIKVNTIVFPPGGAIVKENDSYLNKVTPLLVTQAGNGHFSITDPIEDLYYLYFATTDNSDPRTNGNTYVIYLPVVFLSRSLSIGYLTVLSLILVWFLIFVGKSPENRSAVRREGWTSSFHFFIKQEVRRAILPTITNSEALSPGRSVAWKRIPILTIMSGFVYIAFEWLFFITKPSFFDLIEPAKKVEIFFQTGFLLAFPSICIMLLLKGLDSLLYRFNKNGLPLYLSTYVPTAIFACLSLLLFDNFTYTLFSFGIVSTDGFMRVIYAGLIIFWFAYLHRLVLEKVGLRGSKGLSRISTTHHAYALYGLLLLSSTFVMVRIDLSAGSGILQLRQDHEINSKPNIILLGSDGLNANNLSVYGYQRPTTPTMEKLASVSLVGENAFTNAAHSAGSVASMMLSKLTTQTRVLSTPDILQGKDSYLHLPGILKREGYYTAELGVIHYVDAYNLNLRNGFDMVNNRAFGDRFSVLNSSGSGLDDALYFAHLLSDRISERLLHVFYIKKMEHPLSHVKNTGDFYMDEERLEKLLDIITDSTSPFFVHVHMMGTHGPEFYPTVHEFSLGKTQDENWMTEFYDDAILSFDNYLRIILDTLERTGKMDNTILIIYTDHGMRYQVNDRIPLIIHFPEEKFAGRIQANVQNLDIAPTLLDYLELPIPDWMEGTSLIRGKIPPERLILSTGLKDSTSERGPLNPPFYQFGYFNIIHCNKWYRYDVESVEWTSGEITGHTAPCSSEESVYSFDEIKRELATHLEINHFDVSSFP
jgi:hypothetical protein